MHIISASIDIWFHKLGIALENVSKSFSVFGFEVYFYGVIIAVAVLAGLFVATRVAKKTGQNPENYMELVIFAIIFGIIGARLYYVAFAWDEYKDNLVQVFNLRGGGLAIYGAVIAGGLTAWIYSRKKKLDPKLVLDTAACGLITGQMLGRWSNFVNMEAFGRYTDGFTAMRLNIAKVNPSMVSAEHLANKITENGVDYIQVHPTFLYESLWSLMVLIILLIFTKRKKFDGQILLMYLIGYGLGRFWIEGLRTDQLKIGHTDIAVSQLLSAVIVVVSLVLFVLGLKKQKAALPVQEVADIPQEAADEPQEAAEILHEVADAPREAAENLQEVADMAQEAADTPTEEENQA